MSTQLIPVFSGELAGTQAQLVDARLLHGFMEVGKRFASWITERIDEYGFVQDQDFLVSQSREIKSGRGGDRRSKDYHLSLGMAKELAMVERNDKGREVRRYFIECERRALSGLQAQAAVKAIESPTITASEQQTLSELVSHKAKDYGDRIGQVKAEIWSRLHRKFRVAKYNQLPREQLGDAIAYVMGMDIKTKQPEPLEPPPAPANTRNYAYALEHIAYLRDWSKQALDGRNRESFLASVRELEGSLRSGWTEMDEAMLHLTIGAALLRRWRDVH